jgi:hypothetical protein
MCSNGLFLHDSCMPALPCQFTARWLLAIQNPQPIFLLRGMCQHYVGGSQTVSLQKVKGMHAEAQRHRTLPSQMTSIAAEGAYNESLATTEVAAKVCPRQ